MGGFVAWIAGKSANILEGGFRLHSPPSTFKKQERSPATLFSWNPQVLFQELLAEVSKI